MRRFCILFKRTAIAPKRLPGRSHNNARQFHVSIPPKQAVTEHQTWDDAARNADSFALDLDYKTEDTDHLKDLKTLKAAVKARASPVVRDLANKSLQSSKSDHRLEVALLEADMTAKLLDVQQATAIYESLAKDTDLEQLPITVLIYISHLIITSKSSSVDIIEKTLVELLRRWSFEDKDGDGIEGHFYGTWAIFCLIRHLYAKDATKSIFHFRQMISSRPRWPSRAMILPTTVNGIGLVMLIFMIRCCVGWRWWKRAYAIAQALLETGEMDGATTIVVRGAFYELIDGHISAMGSDFEPQLPGALLCSMAQHTSLRPVSASLLRRFYEMYISVEAKQPEVMSSVYLFLKTLNQDSKTITYHPPRGASLFTLLSHYQRTNNQKAMRSLLSDTHRYFVAMGPTRLTIYLSLITQSSFATEAREVYTFCEQSSRPELRLILQSAPVAKSLVSLFVSMAEAAHQRALKYPGEAEKHLATAKDSMAFAKHVTRKFRRRDTPLDQWDHYTLTSLTRINFEVGFFGIGLRAMEIIAKRADMLPDMYDITILLHTLATGDPRAAFDLVKYMIEKDLEPNEVVYGTVVAQAMKHNDFALAQETRALASERGHTLRDPRVLGAVCWHSISANGVANLSIADVETRLRFVLEILGPVTGKETVFRERTLGERAVNVALNVGNPRLAYALWRRFFRNQASTLTPDQTPLSDKDIKLRSRILRKLKNREERGKPVPQSQKDILGDDMNPKPVPWTKPKSMIGGRRRH